MRVKSVIVPEFLEGSGRSFAGRRLIQLAASVASRAESELAAAIRAYYSGEYLPVTEFSEDSEQLSGVVEGNRVCVSCDGSVYSGESYIGRITVNS
ncbi:MAG: hypothetical protein LBC38_04540 [Oscillospiraceae bacterium]|jgi:hypothetical protein|nr:hypothetical protein [Oscillospiraceae bacterium]